MRLLHPLGPRGLGVPILRRIHPAHHRKFCPVARQGDSQHPRSGLDNRLAPGGFSYHLPIGGSKMSNSPSGLLATINSKFNDLIGRALYKYYNWRQDTLSDLQLFIILNAAVIGFGASLRRHIGDIEMSATNAAAATGAVPLDGAAPPWWADLYSVLVVILGQQLPEEQASFSQQVFAVATAVLGVASFALVLALIEQATLELLESNVKRGSKVYESGHYVVLSWGKSARDLSQGATVLRQLCAAAALDGGATIVLLSAFREKLELEEIFRDAVPMHERFGSQIVFRQGSPLDPSALEMVSCTDARAVIILGDYSMPVEDSDSQVLRCAVLLDEAAAEEGKEWISLPKMRGVTGNSNGTGGTVSGSDERKDKATVAVEKGVTTAAASAAAAIATTMGPWVVAEVQGCNAPALVHYACTDRVIPVPTCTINARRYGRLLQHPVVATLSHALFDHASHAHAQLAYFPEATHLLGQSFSSIHAYFPDAIIVGLIDVITGQVHLSPPPSRHIQEGEAFVFLRSSVSEGKIYPLALPMPGYEPGPHWNPETYTKRSVDEAPLGRDKISGACNLNSYPNGLSPDYESSSEGLLDAMDGPRAAPPTCSKPTHRPPGMDQWLGRLQGKRRPGRKAAAQRLAAALLPLSYCSRVMSAGERGDLLICGWAGYAHMSELLRELDHGAEALPPGSKVILLNDHPLEELAANCHMGSLRHMHLHHIRCDPRDRCALGAVLDVSTLGAAIIFHDTLWNCRGGSVTGASADASPYAMSQADMLRIDAAILEVQLNVRYLLEQACCPDINILSEKLTYLGQTRFENRNKLPLGTAVNSASYAAKVLSQIAVQPRSLMAYAQLGVQADIIVQDASDFAEVDEELSFLAMQYRCASVSQVLLGYYRIPTQMDEVLDIVVNPPGQEERTRPMVWNNGDARCKLITLVPKSPKKKQTRMSSSTEGAQVTSSEAPQLRSVVRSLSRSQSVQVVPSKILLELTRDAEEQKIVPGSTKGMSTQSKGRGVRVNVSRDFASIDGSVDQVEVHTGVVSDKIV